MTRRSSGLGSCKRILWAEGVGRTAAVFGEALELGRCIETRVGERRFTVDDRVVNVAFDPATHMYLYHVNVGWPVVDRGAEYLIPGSRRRAGGRVSDARLPSADRPSGGVRRRVLRTLGGRGACWDRACRDCQPQAWGSARTRSTGRTSLLSTRCGGCWVRGHMSGDGADHQSRRGTVRRPRAW